MANHSTAHIYQSLVVNAAIALAKTGAAVYTGSGSMLAEAIHSFSDCANQILLLLGVKRAARPPDALHPFGYGPELYFWSFMVALLIFAGGGVFSVYEGIHKTLHPEPIENIGVAIAILVFSLAMEGASTVGNIREINGRRGALSFAGYLRDTKDSDLIVVFGENAAASLGLAAALVALLLAHFTGDTHWDGIGSLVIGLILIGVAVFLAVEVKSLLVGERADPVIEDAIRDAVAATAGMEALVHAHTLQQGPGQVIVSAKVVFAEALTSFEIAHTVNRFEAVLRAARPEVRWCYIECGLPQAPVESA